MSRRGWALFLAMSVIWGVPYLLIKVAVEEVSPVELVFLRSAIGALVLLPWALHLRALLESVHEAVESHVREFYLRLVR